jgi:CRP/FNR family transcriptional regulator, cyclic AMP receptor protein
LASRSFREAPLFAGLPAATLDRLADISQRRTIAPGQPIVREGERARELFVLLAGTAEVRKREEHRPDVEHVIGQLSPGEVIGEVALFDQLPRSATVLALDECTLWVLAFDQVVSEPKLVLNVARSLARRVRDHGDEMRATAQERASMGELIVKMVVLLCGYALLLSGLPWVQERLPASSSWVSLPIIALFGLGSWRFIRNSGFEMSRFGLGTKHLFGSIAEAVVFTPPFMAAVAGAKWLVMRVEPRWRAMPLIQYPDVQAQLSSPRVLQLLAVYGVSALVQELIVRCALQSSLESYLVGRGRVLKAILVSALMFSVNHLHISFLFAILAFLPGIFWGVLFERRRNIVGVALSHFVVGGFVFFVLGISLP